MIYQAVTVLSFSLAGPYFMAVSRERVHKQGPIEMLARQHFALQAQLVMQAMQRHF